MLEADGRPLQGDIDITSGQCDCLNGYATELGRRNILRAIGLFNKASTVSLSTVDRVSKQDFPNVLAWMKVISLDKLGSKEKKYLGGGSCSSCHHYAKAVTSFLEGVSDAAQTETSRYTGVIPEWGVSMNNNLVTLTSWAAQVSSKSSHLTTLMEASGTLLDWDMAEQLSREGSEIALKLYNLSSDIADNASYNSKVLLEALSHAASHIRRSAVAVSKTVSALRLVTQCLNENNVKPPHERSFGLCLMVAMDADKSTRVSLTKLLNDLPIRPHYSRGHRCKCSLATSAIDAMLLPTTTSIDEKMTRHKINTLVAFNFSKCYDRHIFIVKHRKFDPLGGWPGVVNDLASDGQPKPNRYRSELSCGNKENGYWHAITGLLWDAKLCTGSFKCASPPQWDRFMSDVKSALQLTLNTPYSTTSEDLNRRKQLCYMSRGVGIREDGMEDEDAMRSFIMSDAHHCKGSVLDFTEGSLFYKNFSLQASRVAQCDLLIGPHGAGLGHVIWLSSVYRKREDKAVLFELLGGKTQPWYYHHLSEIAGVNYTRVSTGGESFRGEEGIGLTPNPDFESLSQLLLGACRA
jgi:hypothetical protein